MSAEPDARVVAHAFQELGPAAGIFLGEPGAGRVARHVLDLGRGAARLVVARLAFGARQELLAADGAAARRRDDQALRHVGVADAEVERDAAAHGQAADVGAGDTQVLHQPAEILDEQLDGVRGGIGGNARRRKSAVVPGNDAIAPRKVADLGLPRAIVSAVLVAPDQRIALARLLVVEIDASPCGSNACSRHGLSLRAALWARRLAELNAVLSPRVSPGKPVVRCNGCV